jgi:hypothetical protein
MDELAHIDLACRSAVHVTGRVHLTTAGMLRSSTVCSATRKRGNVALRRSGGLSQVTSEVLCGLSNGRNGEWMVNIQCTGVASGIRPFDFSSELELDRSFFPCRERVGKTKPTPWALCQFFLG